MLQRDRPQHHVAYFRQNQFLLTLPGMDYRVSSDRALSGRMDQLKPFRQDESALLAFVVELAQRP